MVRRNSLAFTLVELLVVIAIIGMLVALILPALGGTRATARQLQCSNNLRNIGMAIINYATHKSGSLPGYIQPIKRSDGKYAEWRGINGQHPDVTSSKYASTTSILASRASWAAHILPGLERQDLWDRIVDGVNFPDDDQTNFIKPIEIYICPDHDELANSPNSAGLSYVVNTGGWDWVCLIHQEYEKDFLVNVSTAAIPMGDTKDNGLFQNLTLGKINNRIDNIHDGASTTLMLSENVHKDPYHTWFGISGVRNWYQNGEELFGMVWVVSTAPTSGITAKNQEPIGHDPTHTALPSELYWEGGPWYCNPASRHAAGVMNVVFADGHGSSIRPEIDYIVYQQLLTTNGSKCVDSANWKDTSIISTFRGAPPLTQADYQ
jgi:prepilin-type N-terminal cleavage/methylation domain-containing protein/prepilin-type processing-associated H-X9-DG protein